MFAVDDGVDSTWLTVAWAPFCWPCVLCAKTVTGGSGLSGLVFFVWVALGGGSGLSGPVCFVWVSLGGRSGLSCL